MTNFSYLISKIVVYKLRQMFGADQVIHDDATGNITVSGIDFEIHETSGLTALNALVVDQTLGYSKEIHEDSESKFASEIADYIRDTALEYLEEGQYQSIEESQTITAAQTVGTVFYQVTEDNVKDALHGDKGNMWMAAEFDRYSWDCIDADKSLYGSVVVDDTLYLCVTDGQDISVAGEMVNPEEALEKYDLETLASYIQESTPDIILRYITEYEIKFKDVEDTAIYLLEDGNSFADIVEAASAISLID